MKPALMSYFLLSNCVEKDIVPVSGVEGSGLDIRMISPALLNIDHSLRLMCQPGVVLSPINAVAL